MSVSPIASALLVLHDAHARGIIDDTLRGALKNLVLQSHEGALGACEAMLVSG